MKLRTVRQQVARMREKAAARTAKLKELQSSNADRGAFLFLCSSFLPAVTSHFPLNSHREAQAGAGGAPRAEDEPPQGRGQRLQAIEVSSVTLHAVLQ